MGGLAGAAGAALAHVLSILLSRHGFAELFHGPFGPPFFISALHTGVFYGALGATIGRRAAATVGFFGGFLGLFAPLYVLSRYAGLTARQWYFAENISYILALWGTIAGIGAASSATKPWRGAAAAALGSLAGYAAFAGVLAVFHGIARDAADPNLRPPLISLLNGLFSGAGLCLALSLDEQLERRPS